MSYQPTNWKAGDTVTSAKLNKIEEGIANSSNILIVQDENGTLNKTWREIAEADISFIVYKNTTPFVKGILIVLCIINDAKGYTIEALTVAAGESHPIVYIATSPDDYPTYVKEDSGPVV